MTNHQKIKGMSVEEMAKFMYEHWKYACKHCQYNPDSFCLNKNCEDGYKLWLEQETTAEVEE